MSSKTSVRLAAAETIISPAETKEISTKKQNDKKNLMHETLQILISLNFEF